jgi:hypothetical protein
VSISVPVQGVSQITVTVTSQVDFNYHVWRAIFVNGTPKRTLITFHCLKCTWIVLAPLIWHRQISPKINPVFSPIIAEICADLYLVPFSNTRIATELASIVVRRVQSRVLHFMSRSRADCFFKNAPLVSLGR